MFENGIKVPLELQCTYVEAFGGSYIWQTSSPTTERNEDRLFTEFSLPFSDDKRASQSDSIWQAYSGTLSRPKSPKVALSRLKSAKVALSRLCRAML